MEFNPSIPPGSTRYFVHLWKQDQRQAFQPQLCQPGSIYSRIALTLGSGFTFFGLQSCCFLSTRGPNTSQSNELKWGIRKDTFFNGVLRHSSFEERVGPTLLVNCSQPASIFANVGATFASDHPHQIGPRAVLQFYIQYCRTKWKMMLVYACNLHCGQIHGLIKQAAMIIMKAGRQSSR